ncbi:MAG: hypothetical protein ACM3XM_17120 [Mycobacterium leprae]
MNRLSRDPRFKLTYEYHDDFIPNPFHVSILDDSVTLDEIAAMIYAVAQHGVLYEGKYLAGSEADRDRHR